MAARLAGVVAVAGAATAAGVTTSSSSAHAAGDVWDRVAACESGGNWSIASGNGYYGGLQFSKSSWKAAGGTKYASMPHKATKAQQIAVAQNLLRMQGPGAWPVCSRKAGLTRANGLASSGGASAGKGVTNAPSKKGVKPTGSTAGVQSAWLNRADTRDFYTWLGMDRHHFLTKSGIKALQRKAGVAADGVIGPNTVRAVENLIGAKRTGLSYFTKGTINVLSHYIQARV
ncbi:hypothetical protein GZ176_10510 [Dermatophilus congolensis]|nr:hypothetical protein [Dermatophilus congolensis]MBO3132701.1 hypothetical protein [Dermatophilus congolensis]MBO3133136.1 hypothetical protein [Dermatophilus congolensis]MBO3135371.1 hypothetical protein [Dermatophilus congolensis]MBO3137612.1 hypothetical protein [Dermatophilus congolensis]